MSSNMSTFEIAVVTLLVVNVFLTMYVVLSSKSHQNYENDYENYAGPAPTTMRPTTPKPTAAASPALPAYTPAATRPKMEI
jgi:hypothetical protein